MSLSRREFIATGVAASLAARAAEQKPKLTPKADLFAFEVEDIAFEDYQAHPAIRAPIAV